MVRCRVEHRIEVDGRDAQRLQVLDDRRHRERQVLAAPLGRHIGMQLRETLDVQLVDQRVSPGNGGQLVAVPVELPEDRQALAAGAEAAASAASAAVRFRALGPLAFLGREAGGGEDDAGSGEKKERNYVGSPSFHRLAHHSDCAGTGARRGARLTHVD